MPNAKIALTSEYVALLRGVNVGGKNLLPMVDLRLLFESLGYSDVRTYIQSGNAIFRTKQPPIAAVIEAAIKKQCGIITPVILRTLNELNIAIEHNPFVGVEGSKLHIGFLAHAPTTSQVVSLDAQRFVPERFAVGTEIYLHLPQGMARTKLPGYLDRQLKIPITMRNWNTVTGLVELASRR